MLTLAWLIPASIFGYLTVARGTYGYIKYTGKMRKHEACTYCQIDRTAAAFLWPVSLTNYMIRFVCICIYRFITGV